jgi:hypothetical protein
MSTLGDEDILKAAEDWRKAGRGVALATVVETWGSAPRGRSGSRAAAPSASIWKRSNRRMSRKSGYRFSERACPRESGGHAPTQYGRAMRQP